MLPRYLRRTLVAVVVLILGVGAAAAALSSVVPAVAGADVTTRHNGALVVTRPQPVAEIDPGDRIRYSARGGPRIATVTSGDDATLVIGSGEVIAAERVRGVVWYELAWLGSVRDALGSPAGLFYLAGLLMLLVAVHQLARRESRMETDPDDPGNAPPLVTDNQYGK